VRRGALACVPARAGMLVAFGCVSGVLADATPFASMLLLGVTMALGPGARSSFSRRRGGASGGAEALYVVVLRRWRVLASR
jgi:hypothetical protein